MTLVELLLAITLFSVLLASIGGLVHSAMTVQVGWHQTVVPVQRMERSLLRLEMDLESAVPLFGVPFLGETSRIELAHLEAAGSAGHPEWWRIRYAIVADGPRLSLVRESSIWREGVDGASQRREVLMELTEGSFAFGMTDEDGALVWVDAWDGVQHGIPRLAHLTCILPAVGSQAPIALSRVFRNPTGNLPQVETP